MQQAAPVLQELEAYGVDISKGEASNVQYTGSGTEKQPYSVLFLRI